MRYYIEQRPLDSSRGRFHSLSEDGGAARRRLTHHLNESSRSLPNGFVVHNLVHKLQSCLSVNDHSASAVETKTSETEMVRERRFLCDRWAIGYTFSGVYRTNDRYSPRIGIMSRIRVAQILKTGQPGTTVDVRGWVRTKRESKQEFAFLSPALDCHSTFKPTP